MRILLKFGQEASSVCRCRLTYAFRLFCAVYGHQPFLAADQETSADACICYGSANPSDRVKPTLFLRHLTGARPPWVPAPPPSRFSRGGENTMLYFPPPRGAEPDWLGEIFEWVSCADEYSVRNRDSVGRIPFSATYVGRHGLNPSVPYAGVAMSGLQQALYRRLNRQPELPCSPSPATSHFVVSTHDIDYWPSGRLADAHRLAKNAAINLALAGRLPLSIQQAGMALRVAVGGHDPLRNIYRLAEYEQNRGISGTYFFLTCHRHRRDANYTINRPDVIRQMQVLTERGMEVGAHGSYTSLDRLGQLNEECDSLQKIGVDVWGSRQHWLRFTLSRLIPAVEHSGLRYDASLGWADRPGFRGGACFAFPPYNFEEERAAPFLELPLVIMDQSLHENFANKREGELEAQKMLAASRRFGWGGISVLWHPAAFGGGWLSPEAGEAFWRLTDRGIAAGDRWLSARAFLQTVRQRYIDVGLLPSFPAPIQISTAPRGFSPNHIQAI